MIQSRLSIILFVLLAGIAISQLIGTEMRTTAQFMDGSASGTVFKNLYSLKRRQIDEIPTETERNKRQTFFNDGTASGTVLSNLY